MKEFFVSIWLGIGSLLGIEPEKVEKPIEAQEIHYEKATVEDILPPTVAPADKVETSYPPISQHKDASKTESMTYDVPKDAPWWSPVAGSETISESVQEGQEGQVSTIWGNGSQGQTERSMDHPRDLQLNSKGHVYFVDGSQYKAKLRMFNGRETSTVVDLVNNKISRRDGYFLSAGLAIIHDNVYISSTNDLFRVVDGRITQLTPKIKAYMKNKRLSDIYRIEPSGEYIYMMFMNKSRQYHIARYNPEGGAVEEILQTQPMPSPYNFYIHGDNEIFITTTNGYVIWEILFPRQTKIAWEAADSQTEITDVWIGSNDSMYFAQWEEQTRCIIYENPVGISAEEVISIAGSRRGFTDGIDDEVEMDYPIDFVWDGTGYLFADMGNNAIRKLWTKVGPMKP